MMATKPRDPDLAYWADLIERLRWAGFLLDRDQRLVWASPDLQRFLGSPAQEELGYGLHVLEALRRDPWRQIATPESQTRLQGDLGRVLISDALARSIKLDVIPKNLRPLVDQIEPQSFTRPLASSFDYLEPGGDSELPLYRVNVLAMPLRDDTGALEGVLVLGYMSRVRSGPTSIRRGPQGPRGRRRRRRCEGGLPTSHR